MLLLNVDITKKQKEEKDSTLVEIKNDNFNVQVKSIDSIEKKFHSSSKHKKPNHTKRFASQERRSHDKQKHVVNTDSENSKHYDSKNKTRRSYHRHDSDSHEFT